MKKVLIITSSPFNNTKLGRMCSQLMYYFRAKGIPVACAAWDHDTSWYVEDEEGVCWYEKEGNKIGPVYPVFNVGEGAANQLYDVIKKLQIDTVLSIGDFCNIEHIYAIKALEKEKIEWINILNNGSYPINENRIELINSIDYHILLNKCSDDEFKRIGVDEDKYSLQRWGSVFSGEPPKKKGDKFGIACVATNSNQSNLGCFITAVQNIKNNLSPEKFEKLKFYLHTNLYDGGDYDIEYLLDRHGVRDCIELPEDFIGVNEGISGKKFKDKLSQYDVVIDCSCQSATGISVLDCMALGLVPIVSEIGALAEIGREMNKKTPVYCDHRISGLKFIAADEKFFYVTDDIDIMDSISDIYRLWASGSLLKASIAAQKISSSYDLGSFLENTYKIIKEYKANSDKLVVETF